MYARVQPQGLRHFLSGGVVVSGEHHRLFDMGPLEFLNRPGGVLFHLVFNQNDILAYSAVHRHMDHCSGLMRIFMGDAFTLHELAVAGQYGFLLHNRLDPVAGDFLHAAQARMRRPARQTPAGWTGRWDGWNNVSA